MTIKTLKDGKVTMAKTNKELEYKLKDYPQTKHNMLQHSVFHDFLSKASDEQLAFAEDFFDNYDITRHQERSYLQRYNGKFKCREINTNEKTRIYK